MKKYYVFLVLLLAIVASAQQVKVLTLEQCQNDAREYYPLSKKRDLIAKSLDYSLSNISKSYLPQLSGVGQLSWQSDVTEIPGGMAGFDSPEISQTQYKVYTDVNQLIFDGGATKRKKESEKSRANVEVQSLEVELYTLHERVNNLYFGLLLIDEQQRLNDLYKEDLRIGLKTVEAQIENGTSFRSNADILNAELLKADQQTITLSRRKRAYLDMLGLFIGTELGDETLLEIPAPPIAGSAIIRPEMQLFDAMNERFDTEKKMINTRDLPKLSLFAQAGLSDPGLNMFADGMQNYFIGGARITWSLTHTKKKEKAIIDLKKLATEADREAFVFNTNQQLSQQTAEIDKLQKQLAVDDNIIKLRNNVKKAALAQLENGVIGTSDYLREVNEENIALQNKNTHQTELLMAQYNEKTTRGINK
jgi:outer membrane protein TolC